jgi:hypothetical protein
LASLRPIAVAISPPVTGDGNSRREPSGRVTTIPGKPGFASCPIGSYEILSISLIAPFCSVNGAVQTGANGHEKTPSVVRRGLSGLSFAAGSARTTSRRPAIAGAGSRCNEDPAASTHPRNIASHPPPRQGGARSLNHNPTHTRSPLPILVRTSVRRAAPTRAVSSRIG